jgi:hypothetical protein
VIHGAFIRKGHPEFRTPLSISILACCPWSRSFSRCGEWRADLLIHRIFCRILSL